MVRVRFEFAQPFATYCGGAQLGSLYVEKNYVDSWAGKERWRGLRAGDSDGMTQEARDVIRYEFVRTFLARTERRCNIAFFADNYANLGYVHLLESEEPFTVKLTRGTYLVKRKVWSDYQNPNTKNECRSGLFMITKITAKEVKKYASNSATKPGEPERPTVKPAS